MLKIPFWLNINFQNSNSPMMELILYFHDISMILVLMIILNLFFLFLFFISKKYFCVDFPESQSLEDFWLSIPIIFLLFLGFPSIKNLYMYEEFTETDMNMKVIGHQWYWTYEFIDTNFSFESYMNKEKFFFRLLESSNNLIVPMKSIIRFMVSSEDVIHSWTIPSAGIKLDATPGRISQFISLFNRPSFMVGQCSEICGSNHSFMPIVISIVNLEKFIF